MRYYEYCDKVFQMQNINYVVDSNNRYSNIKSN